jgi:hypothetical protein
MAVLLAIFTAFHPLGAFLREGNPAVVVVVAFDVATSAWTGIDLAVLLRMLRTVC